MKTWMSAWLFGRRPKIASPGAKGRRRRWQATPRVDYLEERCLLSADLAGSNFPEVYGRLPLHFEANLGQTDAQVRYVARGAGYALFLTPSEAVLRLHGSAAATPGDRAEPSAVGDAILGLRLLGANPAPAIVGLDPLPGHDNYLIGNDPRNWRGDVATYSRVAYHGIYPGVDLVYYGNQSQLEYDFVVAPGADPSAIQLDVEGARSITTNAAGDLVLHTAAGDVVEHAPVLYQEAAGIRQPVSGRFVLEGGGRVGFQVGAFDHAQALVIDPVLGYGTYLGGSGQDGGTGIAVDAAGNAYITGYTASANFPVTPDADQTTNHGGSDVFVAKLNAAGTQLVYATYLGGSGQDGGMGIAVDAAGNAYVTGYTASSNFPVTPGAFQTTQHGSLDAFVVKLNAAGTQLVYATYLGGSDGNEAMSIAVDAAGNAYVTGQTSSANFPVTPGAYQTTRSGIQNGFVAELNAAGTQLVYATYLGGSGSDGGAGIAVDTAGNAYVTGYTDSTNFPVTAGAFQTSNHGGDDAFVAKVNPNGTALVYATYLGGLANEEGIAIAVDAAGNAYVTGATDSPNFPTTLGAFQTRSHGGGDAFVAKLNAAGAQLVYATYLGGSGRDGGTGIAVDAVGNAYVTGSTSSFDFPTTPGAFQTERHGSADAFVAKLNAAGTQLAYATYLGGTGTNLGTAVAVDATGNAYVTGSTDATNFPTTSGAFQTSNHGSQDAFVVKVDTSGPVTHFRLTTSARAVAAGTVLSVTVAALDAYDTPTSSYQGVIHFSSSDTAAVLPADYRYTADDHGIHTFAATLKTDGDQTIIATDTTDAALTDRAMITVSAAAASHFRVVAPAGTTAGAAFAVTVTALDPYGNVALRYTGAVHFSSSDTAAVLPADYPFNLGDNGTHTFSGVLLKTAGMKAITATDTITDTISGSATVMVSAAAASHLSVAAPVGTIAGVVFGITVTARDSYENVAPQYTGIVHFSSTDRAATLPADYRFTAADAGVHTFTGILLKTTGTKTITATDTTTGAINGSAAVMVSAAAASHFGVSAPAGTTAGATFIITVTALDPYDNVASRYTGTVHFSSSDTAATLPSNYSFTAADAGVHPFGSLVLKTTGTKTITATDTITGTINGSAVVTVSAAAASHFSIAAPAGTTAGAAFGITVTALDPYDNVAPRYTGTAHFSSSDAMATLPADYRFTAADAGVHTFAGVLLKTAGTKTITATDAINGSAAVMVSAAAANHLSIAAPASITAGATFAVTVTARDPYGNVAPRYTGTVHFSSSDNTAALPSNYSFTAADAGVHPFGSLALKTAGTKTITATDTITGTISGSAAVMVGAGAASHLSVAGPAGITAGAAFAITVTALDPFGNVASRYTGTAHFSSTDTAATLPADYRFTLGDNGIHTFTGVFLKTAGTKTITATDTVTGAINGSAVVMVRAAAASHFSVATSAGTTAGAMFAITVTALDPYGNVAPRYAGTVHFSSSDTVATLPADYRFTATDAGVHTFAGVLLKTAGMKAITATDTITDTISGSATVMVSAAAASRLGIAAPAGTTAGVMFGITVTARDPYENVAPQYTGIVHFSSTDRAATLPADYRFTATDAGVHTFGGLTLRKAGRQTVTTTDTANLMGPTVGVTVAPANATALQVGGFPTPVAAGTPGTAAVTAVDAFGNISTGYRGAVHFTSSDPRSQLPADYTFTAVDSGTHPFTATFITPGRQSLTAAALANPNLRGEQTGITVTGDSVVGNISTHTVLGPLHPVKLGRPVTFTATITAMSSGASSPFGSVTFYDATTLLGTPIPLVNGTATLTVATLGLGRHTITAHFTGSGDFQGSVSAPGIQVVHNAAFAAVGGNNGRVQIRRTADDSLVFDFIPYPGYTGPVNVAFGDITGDGFDDLITGASAGNPHVKVYNGAALANGTFNAINPDASLVASFFAYGLNFNVGATVAAGDIEGNGYADLVTGTSAGNPQVKIYRGQDIAQGHFQPDGASQVVSFFAYGLQFNVGVNVAVGDVTGDGHADLVTGASVGNPHIKVYDGQAFAAGTFNSAHPDTSVLAQWFAFGLQFNIGATVAVGDVDGNGFGDVITGASAGNPQVKVYDGRAIVEGSLTMVTAEAHVLDQFYAAALNQNLGVTVGASDFENTGRSDILTGITNGIPTVKVFRGSAAGINPPPVFGETLAGFPNGIDVGV